MISAKTLEDFIDKLARAEVDDTVFNQYSYKNPASKIRRNNLLLYFQQLAEREPKVLLVGEAPGYQGCRLTGIPFMSESILLKGIDKVDMFGHAKGYRKTDEYPEKTWNEPSATIVWGVLQELETLPLLWASFPFHPHDGEPHTNRAPKNTELEIGKPFLKEIIDIFDIAQVIAVGNKADMTLSSMGISAPKIRHPSHGGKHGFTDGVRAYMK